MEDDEIDPLDAFMDQNDARATELIKKAEEKAKEEEEDEVDPLDAFMAAEVLPAVTQNGISKPSEAKVHLSLLPRTVHLQERSCMRSELHLVDGSAHVHAYMKLLQIARWV